MSYVFNFVVTVLFGWPALIAGYVFSAIKAEWNTGKFLYKVHDDAIVNALVKKGGQHD